MKPAAILRKRLYNGDVVMIPLTMAKRNMLLRHSVDMTRYHKQLLRDQEFRRLSATGASADE